jgi:hypothetical protein
LGWRYSLAKDDRRAAEAPSLARAVRIGPTGRLPTIAGASQEMGKGPFIFVAKPRRGRGSQIQNGRMSFEMM